MKISIAKGSLWERRFWRIWHICRKWWIWQTFDKVLAKIQIRWQRSSLKVAILTKTAKCRQRLHTVMDVCVVLKTTSPIMAVSSVRIPQVKIAILKWINSFFIPYVNHLSFHLTLANVRHIRHLRQSHHFRQNRHSHVTLCHLIWIFANTLANVRQIRYFHQILHFCPNRHFQRECLCHRIWTFAQNFGECSPYLSFTPNSSFCQGRHS